MNTNLTHSPWPWVYAPEAHTDGGTIGVSHFVLDADGNEICCPASEADARLFVAIPALLRLLGAVLERDEAQGYGGVSAKLESLRELAEKI